MGAVAAGAPAGRAFATAAAAAATTAAAAGVDLHGASRVFAAPLHPARPLYGHVHGVELQWAAVFPLPGVLSLATPATLLLLLLLLLLLPLLLLLLPPLLLLMMLRRPPRVALFAGEGVLVLRVDDV